MLSLSNGKPSLTSAAGANTMVKNDQGAATFSKQQCRIFSGQKRAISVNVKKNPQEGCSQPMPQEKVYFSANMMVVLGGSTRENP